MSQIFIDYFQGTQADDWHSEKPTQIFELPTETTEIEKQVAIESQYVLNKLK